MDTPSDKGEEKIKQKIYILLMIAGTVVVGIITAALTSTPPASVEENTSPQPPELTLEDSIKAALAENRGVSTEVTHLQFYRPTENQKILAVGAVVENLGSYLFFYDQDSGKITKMQLEYEVENGEIAAVADVIAHRKSVWTGNLLVPHFIEKMDTDNVYHFWYCDGYIPEWSKWSMGTASIDMDNQEIEWEFFF